MATTTKKDLIDRIAEETKQKRSTVKKTIQTFLEQVIVELSRGNRLEFRDFGVFEIRDRAPRIAQNPKTLERVPVPAKKTVKFKVGRLMKMALDNEGDVELEGTEPVESRSGNSPDLDGGSPARAASRPAQASHRADGQAKRPQTASISLDDDDDDDD